MEGRHERDSLVFAPMAAHAADGSLIAKQGLRGDPAKADNHLRGNGSQLTREKRFTGGYFIWFRVTVTRRAAFFHVTDVDFGTLQAHGEEDPVKQLSGFADKRLTLQVLLATWSLANQDQACVGTADAENDVIAFFTQFAAVTFPQVGPNLFQGLPRPAFGHQVHLIESSTLPGGQGHLVNAESGKILDQDTSLADQVTEIPVQFIAHGSFTYSDCLSMLEMIVRPSRTDPGTKGPLCSTLPCLRWQPGVLNPGTFMAPLIICLTLLLVALPSHGWAWGIGFHLQVGSQVLERIGQVAPHLQALLAAFPEDYLYGCIAADITLGKKFTHYLQHCHSWRVARQLINRADGDAQQACAYGYLSHLAMDTVAHSYFVPYKMVRTFNTVLMKHTYWEMRIEGTIDPEIWSLARTIARRDFTENDALLRSVIANTLFSFGTNKRIFNSLLLLSRLQHWQKMIRSLGRNSRWEVSEEDRSEYFSLARTTTESILSKMEQSPYWKADPAGERALNAAKMIRKNLNLLWLDGKLSETDAERLLAELKPRFREGITSPERLLEMLSSF